MKPIESLTFCSFLGFVLKLLVEIANLKIQFQNQASITILCSFLCGACVGEYIILFFKKDG